MWYLTFLPAPGLSLDQIAYKPNIVVREIDGISVIVLPLSALVDHVLEEASRGPLVRPLPPISQHTPQEVVVEHVRERAVTQVVTQTRYTHVVDVSIADLE